MHSPAQSPILDVTETVSMHSELDAELESEQSVLLHFHSPESSANRSGLSWHDRCQEIVGNSTRLRVYRTTKSRSPGTGISADGAQSCGRNWRRYVSGFCAPSRPRWKATHSGGSKDAKYFERRKRNNEAAKKSRDARKIREDRIAFRAALLEQENSILRTQVLALRDELQTVRQLLGATTAGGMLSMARQVWTTLRDQMEKCTYQWGKLVRLFSLMLINV